MCEKKDFWNHFIVSLGLMFFLTVMLAVGALCLCYERMIEGSATIMFLR